MKIVHVAQSLGLGGLEVLIQRISMALREEGHELAVVALSDGGPVADQLQAADIPVIICRPAVRGLRNLPQLRDTLLALNADVLHLHGLPCGTLGRLATMGAGIRTVYHLHTAVSEAHHPTSIMRLRERLLSLLPGKIVTVSESVKQDYTSTFLIPPSRVDVLPGGVPDLPTVNRATARTSFSIPDDAFLISMVASLTPVKRHRDVLDAIALIPGAHLAFAGEGPLEGELKRQASEQGIEDRVHFLGRVNEVHSLFSASDLAVLASSPREGLGLALIEAQRAGIPAIGTAVGGIPEVVVDGVCGLIVPPESPETLASAIRELKENSSLRKQMGIEARNRYEQTFAMDHYIERLLTLYRS